MKVYIRGNNRGNTEPGKTILSMIIVHYKPGLKPRVAHEQ